MYLQQSQRLEICEPLKVVEIYVPPLTAKALSQRPF